MRFNENPSEECTGIEAHLTLEVTIHLPLTRSAQLPQVAAAAGGQ